MKKLLFENTHGNVFRLNDGKWPRGWGTDDPSYPYSDEGDPRIPDPNQVVKELPQYGWVLDKSKHPNTNNLFKWSSSEDEEGIRDSWIGNLFLVNKRYPNLHVDLILSSGQMDVYPDIVDADDSHPIKDERYENIDLDFDQDGTAELTKYIASVLSSIYKKHGYQL